MKIIALRIQMRRTSLKLVTQNISLWKETLSQKLGISKNPTALTLLSKVPAYTIILVPDIFFNFTIWKPTAQAFQNTLNFDQFLFNSRSNFLCKFSPLKFTAPKKRHFTYFFRTNTTFSLWKSQNQNLQPTPSESWVHCGHFEPKGGGPRYTKSTAIILSTRWQ